MDLNITHILVIPVVAGLISQFAKYFIKSNNYKFDPKQFIAYSGMPSSHSAIVSSLATIVALDEGLSSPLFAISFILAVIVIRDAWGIRRYLGEHSKVINILIKELKDDKVVDQVYPNLTEKIGHTFAQVLVGSIIGFIVSIIGYAILNLD